MNALHLIHTPRHSGAEILVRDLCLMHQAEGVNCAIASFEPCEPHFLDEERWLANAGVKLFFPPKRLTKYERVAHFKRVFSIFGPSVILAHSVLPSFYGRMALPFIKAHGRFITVLHSANNDDISTAPAVIAERVLRFRQNAVVAVSEEGQQNYMRRFGDRIPVELIQNGISLSRFRSIDRPTARRKFGLGEGNKLFLQVGRIDDVKQQHVSLRGLAGLLRQGGAELWFAGLTEDANYEADLRELALQEGVLRSVRFLGSRDDVPELLAAADLYLMPSRAESQGIALLEALASGVPTIASEIPAFKFAGKMPGVALVGLGDWEAIGAQSGSLIKLGRFHRDLDQYEINITARKYKNIMGLL
ncbi:group 1 glycosyl transferase [Sphingomonas sp. LH128]|uniref:glycosyltransferase family 4 protein n=1 Tax=Sphingomonas sp. LH128 TaxID=473781 RepID=UPI00027CA4BB|nr:glycosyltransferase family 4 protein [Sphingomonas sp. LH128]EJU08910.1 group 1 glycosyl transferase [Sphingomonas sp. LH128]